MPKYNNYAALDLTSGLAYPRATGRHIPWTIDRSPSSLPFHRSRSVTGQSALAVGQDHRSGPRYSCALCRAYYMAMVAPERVP